MMLNRPGLWHRPLRKPTPLPASNLPPSVDRTMPRDQCLRSAQYCEVLENVPSMSLLRPTIPAETFFRSSYEVSLPRLNTRTDGTGIAEPGGSKDRSSQVATG